MICILIGKTSEVKGRGRKEARYKKEMLELRPEYCTCVHMIEREEKN